MRKWRLLFWFAAILAATSAPAMFPLTTTRAFTLFSSFLAVTCLGLWAYGKRFATQATWQIVFGIQLIVLARNIFGGVSLAIEQGWSPLQVIG